MNMEKEFKQMEGELNEKAKKVEKLIDTIKSERTRVPTSINEAESVTDRLKTAEDELVALVGLDEFNRLMKEVNIK